LIINFRLEAIEIKDKYTGKLPYQGRQQQFEWYISCPGFSQRARTLSPKFRLHSRELGNY